MSDIWKSIFKGTIEDRPVEIEIYDEGGIRIHTTQGADQPDVFETDGYTTLHMPSTEKGRKITIEGEKASDIKKDLLSEGFSEEASDMIISLLP